ncbi:MAG: mechanosensitive ion channel family protein [Bacteroidales bacterium]|nr:mechanosensitive ion channel family protein [Bacteroidales bacterium]
MKRILFSCLIIFCTLTSFSEDTITPRQNVKYNLSSPYHSIITFLKYLQEDNYHPKIAAKAFDQRNISEEEAIDYAIKLKQALDGKGVFIKIDDLPRNSRYFDTIAQKHIYILSKDIPEIYIELVGRRWVFPENTFPHIIAFHNHVYPFGTEKLLEVLPKFGEEKYLGLFLWQIIALLIYIFLSVVFHKLLSFIIEKFIHKSANRMGYPELANSYYLPIARPISILIIFLIFIALLPALQLPVGMYHYINIGIKILMPVFATLVFYKMVDVLCLYLDNLAGKSDTGLDDQLVPLIRKVLKVVVVIIGSLFILQNLNVNITALLAGISIGGLAFALAAQDTLKNFFGSLMIFLDKPFQIGHWITSGDIDGTVEEVGFRSTRVRTFRNSLTYVPNGKLADATIDNHGLRNYRRFSTTISITYDTPTPLIEAFVEGLNRIIVEHPNTRKDFHIVRLNDFAPSSLNILFYTFFDVPTWEDELRCREEIILKIINLADFLKIRFAYPTQTIYMGKEPEKPKTTTANNEDVDYFKKQLDTFFVNKK